MGIDDPSGSLRWVMNLNWMGISDEFDDQQSGTDFKTQFFFLLQIKTSFSLNHDSLNNICSAMSHTIPEFNTPPKTARHFKGNHGREKYKEVNVDYAHVWQKKITKKTTHWIFCAPFDGRHLKLIKSKRVYLLLWYYIVKHSTFYRKTHKFAKFRFYRESETFLFGHIRFFWRPRTFSKFFFDIHIWVPLSFYKL